MRGKFKCEKNQYQCRLPSDRGAEDCRSCLGRELQSTGAWWVIKDMSVTLRRERTLRTENVGECMCMMMSKERRV